MAWPLTLWGALAPEPYGLCIALLAVAPVVGLVIAPAFEGGTGLTSREGEPHGVLSLLLGPVMALGLRGVVDLAMIDPTGPGVAGAGIGAVFASLALWRTGQPLRWFMLAFLALAGFAYGWTVAIETNALLRPAKPNFIATEVLDRWASSSSRYRSYYLTLSAPLYPGVPARIGVEGDLFNAVQVGDELCLKIYRGVFGWRWYELDFCPA